MLPMKAANAITELFKTLFSKQVLLYRISLHAQKYKKGLSHAETVIVSAMYTVHSCDILLCLYVV